MNNIPTTYTWSDEKTVQGGIGRFNKAENKEQKTTIFEATKKAFRLENTLGSWISDETNKRWTVDEDFDFSTAYDSLPESYQLNEDISNKFSKALNQDHFNAIKSQIDRELEDREYMANAGWKGVVANLTAGIIDPINLIPIGGTAFRVGKGGYSILKAGLRTASVAAGAITAQELALHSSQQLRTGTESAFNVGAGALLGGVLGATGRAWVMKNNPKEFDKLAKGLQKELTIPSEDLAYDKQSIGAASINTKSTAELLAENSLKYDKVFKPIAKIHPNLRLLYSPNVTARLGVQRLAEIVPTLKKNAKGIATNTSVESKIKLDKADLGYVLGNLDTAYKTQKLRLGNTAKKKIKFNEDVSKALIFKERAKDMGVSQEAIDASEYVKRNVFDKYAKRGLEIEGFWDNPKEITKNMDRYFHRLYDKPKIVKNYDNFIKVIGRYIEKEYIKTLEEKATAKTPKQKGKVEFAQIAASDKEIISEEAQKVFEKVTGQESDVWQGGIALGSGKGSPLKGRKLLIPEEELIDFLELDIEKVLKHYTNSMSPRLQLAKEFGNNFLTDNLSTAPKSQVLKDYISNYNDLVAKTGNDPKKLLKLKTQKEQDLSDIFALRDRLLGRYGYSENPNSWSYRVQKGLKQLSTMTLLGDVGASQLPDIGKIIMSGGVFKLFSKGINPFIKNVKSTKLNTTHRQQMQRMLNGLTLYTESRSMKLAGVMEDYGRHTKFERGLDFAADKAMLITGMNHINMGLRNAVSGAIQSEIYDAMKAVVNKTASKKTIEKLAVSGINTEDAIKMFKLINKHGDIVDDIIFPATQLWGHENRYLTDIFEATMQKELDAAIVTPGVGNTPLWMSKSGLNLLGQFKSFAFSSMEKTVIPLIQNFDVNKAQGLVAMVSLGTMVAAYKHKIAGRKIPEAAALIQEGIDRSGVLAYLVDWHNGIEDFTRGAVSISQFTGANKGKKYYNRLSLLGPSTKQAENIYKILSDIASGKPRRSTTHAARMLIPLQNMIGIRQVLDAWEDEFNQNMNVKK